MIGSGIDRFWKPGWGLTIVGITATSEGIPSKVCSDVGGACWKKIGRMRTRVETHTQESETPTKPEDPEEADEAKFTGSQRRHGTFAEEVDNQS